MKRKILAIVFTLGFFALAFNAKAGTVNINGAGVIQTITFTDGTNTYTYYSGSFWNDTFTLPDGYYNVTIQYRDNVFSFLENGYQQLGYYNMYPDLDPYSPTYLTTSFYGVSSYSSDNTTFNWVDTH